MDQSESVDYVMVKSGGGWLVYMTISVGGMEVV